MTGLVIVGSMADQGGVNDYAADLVVGTRHLELESLTVLNKSATNYYLQLFDYGFAVGSARAVTLPNAIAGMLVMSSPHYLRTGDYVSTGGTVSYMGSAYVRALPDSHALAATGFYLYGTKAQALNLASTTGLISGSSDGDTGTVTLAAAADAPVVPEELPLLGTGSSPANIVSYLNGRFRRGLYVRGVTAINGSTLAGTDLKITPRFRYAHGF